MNWYALFIATFGFSVAKTSNDEGNRMIGAAIAGVATNVLIGSHIREWGGSGPEPVTVEGDSLSAVSDSTVPAVGNVTATPASVPQDDNSDVQSRRMAREVLRSPVEEVYDDAQSRRVRAEARHVVSVDAYPDAQSRRMAAELRRAPDRDVYTDAQSRRVAANTLKIAVTDIPVDYVTDAQTRRLRVVS